MEPEKCFLGMLFLVVATACVCSAFAVSSYFSERVMLIDLGCVEVPAYGSSNMLWRCPQPESDYLPFGKKKDL